MKDNSLIVVFTISILFSLSSCSKLRTETFESNIQVCFNDSIYNKSVSGKLIFLFNKDTSQSLIYGVDPNNLHPVFTYDIRNWNTNDTLIIKSFKNSWLKEFSELDGTFASRLIFDCDTTRRSSFVTKENSYSKKHIINLSKDSIEKITFKIENKFNGWVFTPSENITEVRLKSDKLSKFWGYDMYIESTVVLPESYSSNIQKRYPLVFVFPGFGSHHAAVTYGNGQINRYGMNTIGKEKIFVFCNGEFRNGYHHFANSANNGLWEDAFINEFIPFIESNYHVIGDSTSRFLMGQSSGAWTAAWLQVNNPELFTGAFVASPDPLDFRAMRNNIYRSDANFYFPENPDSTQIEKGIKDKKLVILENMIGEYGQIRTWESTFSPKGYDGFPAQLFNRTTGEIDKKVAEHWKNYDLAYIISSNPDYYRQTLNNKLHFFVSENDPYNLEKSIHLLEEICNKNKIEAEFNYYSDLGHNVWSDKVRQLIHKKIDSFNQ